MNNKRKQKFTLWKEDTHNAIISCQYISSGYLENYGRDKQEIILLHVYNSIDHVTQYSDDDSEGKILVPCSRYKIIWFHQLG